VQGSGSSPVSWDWEPRPTRTYAPITGDRPGRGAGHRPRSGASTGTARRRPAHLSPRGDASAERPHRSRQDHGSPHDVGRSWRQWRRARRVVGPRRIHPARTPLWPTSRIGHLQPGAGASPTSWVRTSPPAHLRSVRGRDAPRPAVAGPVAALAGAQPGPARPLRRGPPGRAEVPRFRRRRRSPAAQQRRGLRPAGHGLARLHLAHVLAPGPGLPEPELPGGSPGRSG
jgi:hypothetical protein